MLRETAVVALWPAPLADAQLLQAGRKSLPLTRWWANIKDSVFFGEPSLPLLLPTPHSLWLASVMTSRYVGGLIAQDPALGFPSRGRAKVAGVGRGSVN